MAEARIQFRRGTASEWTSANPTLAVGELGFETDTTKFKFGDGSTAWTSLAYGFIPITATAPITISDGDIGITEASLTIAQSQVTNLETDLSNKQDVVSGVSDTEIGFLDGVTSAIQTQLNDKLPLTGGTLTGNLTLNADPSDALQAATKQYVDAVAEGLHIHASVVSATTENIDLSTGGLLTVDGVTLSDGNRVLVKDQTAPAENGIYTANSGAWIRADDYNTANEVQAGDFTFVSGGSVYEATGWVQILSVTTLGTDSIEWQQFSGAGTFTAGTGITLTGTQFSVDTDVIAPLASPTFTGTVVLPSTTSIGDVTDTEIGHLDGVTSAIQTQINGKEATITGGASTITSADLTANRALVSDGSGKVAVSDVTATEIGYLDGVTSAIQTQINDKADSSYVDTELSGKQDVVAGVSDTEIGFLSAVTSDIQAQINAKEDTITGGATTIATDDLTASRALVSDGSGKVAVSDVTSTEIGYLDGVTSALQTQLDGKAPFAQTITDKSADYTIVDGDSGSIIRLTGATGRTFTLANVLEIGERVDFFQDGEGVITFAAGAGVTLKSKDDMVETAAQYSAVSAVCVASGSIHLIGDLA